MCEPLNMAEALCMSNIDEVEAKNVANMVDKVFLKQSRSPLLDVKTPIFLSFKIPMLEQCNTIFGQSTLCEVHPLLIRNWHLVNLKRIMLLNLFSSWM